MQPVSVFVMIVALSCWSGVSHAGGVSFSGVAGAYHLKVTSFKEARFRSVYKQTYDFSCGSAALASLLSFHYGYPVTEKAVFDDMYDNGNREKIRSKGFSLLDMKLYLQRRGFDADGYRMSLSQWAQQVAVPAITLINTEGYYHFVVVKGVKSDEVLLGDPAKGVRVMPRKAFEKDWNGIVFLIKNHADKGRKGFSDIADWQVRTKAPFGTALAHQRLGMFSIKLSSPGSF